MAAHINIYFLFFIIKYRRKINHLDIVFVKI